MCGRYSFDPKEWGEFFKDKGIQVDLKKIEAHYNIYPTMPMPVIRDPDLKKVELMRWGLIPYWVQDYKKFQKPLINARVEDIENKPSFRRPIRKQRCLVLANGYWEWLKTVKDRIPYYIKLKGQDTIFFAGIWDEWKDAEGKPLLSFAIITTEANPMVAKIHDKKRMPGILFEEEIYKWLDPETPFEEILKIIRPCDENKMEAYPVPKFKPEDDTKDITKPGDEQKDLF